MPKRTSKKHPYNDCIFQTKQSEIGEARCTIPILLKKGCIRGNNDYSCGTWICEFNNKETECPVYGLIVKIIKNITT